MLTATNTIGQHRFLRRRFPAPSAALFCLCAVWCAGWFFHSRGYWEDDAWIHLEFARSVSRGLGFAFNGRIVAGDSAPLWVFLLVAAHAVVPDWLAAGKLLTVLAAFFGLAGIYAFARRLAQSLPADIARIFPAAILFLTVANPYTCYWIFSGMEPIAAAGLACWVVVMATRQRSSVPSFLLACLLAGIGPLLRPEMFFLAMLLALPLFGQWRRLNVSPEVRLLCAVTGLVLLAGPLLAWSLYSLHTFGHLLPNTNAAKRAGPNESVPRRLVAIYLTGLPLILGGVVAGFAYLIRHSSAVASSLHDAAASAIANDRAGASPRSPACALALSVAGWMFILWTLVSTLFYCANHTYVQTRYILLTAPGVSAVVLALVLRRWPVSGRLLYCAALCQSLAVSSLIVVPLVRSKAANCRAVSQLALLMRNELPHDAPVAVYSIGQIAFESEHPIVDTGGITRPGAIPYLNASLDSMAVWAQGEGAEYYIESQRPLPNAVSLFTKEMPYVGWTVHRSQYAETVPVSIWRLPAPQRPTATVASLSP